MNYWLTVHWPLRVDEEASVEWRNWVFLAEGRERAGSDLKVSDRVFIYETETAPRVREGGRFVYRRPGRKGVVALALVNSKLIDNPNTQAQKLEDGREYRWRFHAETVTEREGFLSLNELRQALGKPGFSARIPGGLMRLNKDEFKRIDERFRSGS